MKSTKLSVIGLALALGSSWAIVIFLTAMLAIILSDFPNVIAFKSMINNVYPGWGENIQDTLLMTVWSFTHGFIGGFLIAYFYNLFAKKFN
jgi:hypothetical protein